MIYPDASVPLVAEPIHRGRNGEIAIGPLLLRKSKSLPTQKCHAPPAVVESSRLIGTINLNNSAISVENR